MRRYELTDEQWEWIEDLFAVGGSVGGTRKMSVSSNTCPVIAAGQLAAPTKPVKSRMTLRKVFIEGPRYVTDNCL